MQFQGAASKTIKGSKDLQITGTAVVCLDQALAYQIYL